MTSFIEQAKLYAAYHQKTATKYTHFAGVPLLMIAAMIFLGFFQIGMINVLYIDFATLGTLALLIYYYRLNWKLAIPLTPLLIFFLWIASLFSYAGPTRPGLWAFVITLVLGVALQFIGHLIEGKKPFFLDKFSQALIAPLFLMAELFFMIDWLPGLKKQMYPHQLPK